MKKLILLTVLICMLTSCKKNKDDEVVTPSVIVDKDWNGMYVGPLRNYGGGVMGKDTIKIYDGDSATKYNVVIYHLWENNGGAISDYDTFAVKPASATNGDLLYRIPYSSTPHPFGTYRMEMLSLYKRDNTVKVSLVYTQSVTSGVEDNFYGYFVKQ